MRKIIFSISVACLALTLNVVAQDTTHTLIKLIKPQTIGLYIAPEASYGQLRGDMTTFTGTSVMLVLNKKWAIGATAQMNVDNSFVPKAISPLTIQSAFGGGKIEYTPRPDALVHVSFPLMIGAGAASADSVRTKYGRDFGFEGKNRNGRLTTNAFVVVQPGINLEMNILRYAKLYVGANYRLSFLADNQTALLPASTLQGFSITGGLRMGLFDFKLNRKKAAVM